jgi:hypothetical protein
VLPLLLPLLLLLLPSLVLLLLLLLLLLLSTHRGRPHSAASWLGGTQGP